ncbi:MULTISPECIES: DUF2141 domain-containing protein [Sphingomonas]|uniref:DUF2141 domain-containing protein n=1 Tax=Sphingomonas TaxID=13687 RepID=UPI0020BDFDB8|nr:DUF2141 domain-containing protein [Sphingomonas faeni]MCK8457685.1 DUF2141 domain-containing protein [Sphingomonas faeni]
MIRACVALAAIAAFAGPAGAQLLGSDAAACRPGEGPAIAVEVTGLKDRIGELKLELYPGDEADFLKDDRVLIAAGKTFRRVVVPTPAKGVPMLCIRVPRLGRYALLLTHNRDGKNKFSFWTDGAGFASNLKLGRSRPKVEQALVEVGAGVTTVRITVQYLRGLGGFGPVTP